MDSREASLEPPPGEVTAISAHSAQPKFMALITMYTNYLLKEAFICMSLSPSWLSSMSGGTMIALSTDAFSGLAECLTH
jgi:hypothetical protein